MKFKLEIDMDNDAFYQNRRLELVRILNSVIESIKTYGNDNFDIRIKDINGNTIGRATIE